MRARAGRHVTEREKQEVFPAAPMDGFSAVRNMTYRSRPRRRIHYRSSIASRNIAALRPFLTPYPSSAKSVSATSSPPMSVRTCSPMGPESCANDTMNVAIDSGFRRRNRSSAAATPCTVWRYFQHRYANSQRMFAKCRCVNDFQLFCSSKEGCLFSRSVLGA
jgi:hypothetical protein